VGTKWQKFDLDLSDYSPEEREAIGTEIIDRIVKRTKSGVDKRGVDFAEYSKAYEQSIEFKAAGKSGSVDLTLTGDMLDSIRILANEDGKLTIGFENGSTENGKADGNIRGTYGQQKQVGPKRDFLGISKAELSDILEKYPLNEEAGHRALQVLTIRDAADKLTRGFKFTLDDLED
jgi:hypothetical protein